MPAEPMTVACLLNGGRVRYKEVARAMAAGINASGGNAVLTDLMAGTIKADVAVMYGWKMRERLRHYRQWVYADLGYWDRLGHYRLSVNSWSPDAYVRAGLPVTRLEALGVEVKPWRTGGDEVLLMGASAKSMHQHGYGYMQWETKTAQRLQKLGVKVVFRPKPNDVQKQPLPVAGVGYDERPLDKALAAAWFVVTHHSNAAIDALVAGVPVHCETGAAAAFSVPIAQAASPELLDGREQFLADVAWLQWTPDEMRSGAAWRHLMDRGVIRC